MIQCKTKRISQKNEILKHKDLCYFFKKCSIFCVTRCEWVNKLKTQRDISSLAVIETDLSMAARSVSYGEWQIRFDLNLLYICCNFIHLLLMWLIIRVLIEDYFWLSVVDLLLYRLMLFLINFCLLFIYIFNEYLNLKIVFNLY